MCFRNFEHADIDTNMHLERLALTDTHHHKSSIYLSSFHNQLKNNPGLMNGKVNKRVDCLINLLLKYETNMFFNRQTKELMWKYNRKEAREKQRHQLGKNIDEKDFTV